MYLSGGKYIACFSDHHAENLPDDARYAWPDVENEDFRKAVCEQYLQHLREEPYSQYSANSFMGGLFGDNFKAIAAEYGNKGTESELLEIAASAWEEIKQTAATLEAQLDRCRFNAPQAILRRIKSQYDNDTRQVESLVADYLQGIKDSLEARIREERAGGTH